MRVHMCGHATCRAMIPITTRYCSEHARDDGYKRNKQQANKVYDTTKRDAERTKFYHSKKWKQLRDYAYRRDYGQCAITHRFDQTIIVDHVVPVKVDASKAFDADNLWLLSLPVHNEKTRIENRILLKKNGHNILKHLDKTWWEKELKKKRY